MTEIIRLINLLDSVYTTSFKHTSDVLYSVKFTNSNVKEIQENIKTLFYNVENNICTGKHVGAPIDTTDVSIVIDSLDKITQYYMTMNNIKAIPSNTKLYSMIREIRDNEGKINVKDTAKEVLTEILAPSTETEKLTPKQKKEAAANAKSKERQLKMLNQHTKK